MTSRIDPAALDAAFTVIERRVASGDAPSGVLGVATSGEVVRVGVASPPGGDTVTGEAITDRHVFLLASITKPIVALAVMRLAERGRIVLSAPIADLLPEAAAPGKPPITAWHLLTHTSGIPDLAWATWEAGQATPERFLELALSSWPAFQPGSRVEYNTVVFSLLGEMVARAAGKPLMAYLRDEILTPSGADAVAFDPWSLGRPVAPVHGLAPAADAASVERAMRSYASLETPGAGLWADVHGLLALGRTLLRDTRDGAATLLAPATLDLMTRLHTGTIPRRADDPPFPARFALAWQKPTAPGESVLPGSPRTFAHDGATGTLLWVDPEHDLTIVFLTNRWRIGTASWSSAVQAVYGAIRPG